MGLPYVEVEPSLHAQNPHALLIIMPWRDSDPGGVNPVCSMVGERHYIVSGG